jgi:hypothetical protein
MIDQDPNPEQLKQLLDNAVGGYPADPSALAKIRSRYRKRRTARRRVAITALAVGLAAVGWAIAYAVPGASRPVTVITPSNLHPPASALRDSLPTTATTDVAQSAAWQQEGTVLKHTHSYTYAYESLPVDVNGPGPQTLDIGPVDPSFSLNTPEAFVYALPPDAHFGIDPHGFAMTTINGERYLQIEVTLLGSNPAYQGFRLWVAVSLS